MQTIGLIGGMSWESSIEYYRLVNQAVRRRLGGFHSAVCLLYSVDFAQIEAYQMAGDWQAAGEVLADAARRLQRAGADIIVLCTNTMHLVADAITAAVDLPFLHIADPTGEAIRAAGIGRIGLLGTRFTMERAFYRQRLSERFGLDVLTPSVEDRTTIHTIIYSELVQGIIRPESRAAYLAVIERMAAEGAAGVILGCTEIGLLVKPHDCSLPLFDTTVLHAEAAVEWALSNGGL